MTKTREKKPPLDPPIFVCPHCLYEIPVDLLQVKPKIKKIALNPKANTAEETMQMILGGGKGTPIWEAYWQLHTAFGGDKGFKNCRPKDTARLFASAARAGADLQKIVLRAEMMRRGTEIKFMPQLFNWLDGLGYVSPDSSTETKNVDGSDRLLPATKR
jgi:hypothetical protein